MKRFLTVGVESEPEEVSQLAEALESQLGIGGDDEPSILLESATERVHFYSRKQQVEIFLGLKRPFVIAVSNSIWGEEEEVRKFLATSVDAEILVLGKDDYGNTVLSMVAAERHPQTVTLLPDHGARINSRNQKGRTPLLEAALWGRAEIVGILLARGADKDMKDREGRKAIDLARQSQENAEERHRRAGGVYKEDTFDADKQRKAVARMLGSQAVISTLTFDLSIPENSN